MQLSCLQENLRRGLSVVQRAVATRSTLPITQNVLLETDASRLKLSATNLEIGITTWIGAQVEEEGAITVPARLLTDFVNTLPDERIDMTTSDEPLSLGMKCRRQEANFNGQSADDFPPIPTVSEGEIGQVSPAVLHGAIDRVAFAAATEDSRPVLTGVKIELAGDKFTFAAADGFRLSIYDGALAKSVSKDIGFILPARALQEVDRLIGDQTDTVEFTIASERRQALFKLDNIELFSQLIDGTFPDFRQLVPESYETRTVVNRDEMLSATRAASVFARDASGIVRLDVSADNSNVKMSARGSELGDNMGEVDVEVEGGDIKIAFNNKYLIDVLDVIGNSAVALETSTSQSPGVIKPAEEDDNFSYTHVIMPMFVQW